MKKTILTVCLGLLAGLPTLARRFNAWDPAPATALGQALVREEGESSSALVDFESRLSHPTVMAGEPQDVFLCLLLRVAEVPRVKRLGLNLALVIDRSGSMASESKLRYAKSAAEQLVGRLRPDDRLSIVTFDDQIHTLVPPTPAHDREVFLRAIRTLESGNSTDLHGGMVQGYDQVLLHFDESRLNRVLLVSDGLANSGVTDPSEILAKARSCRDRGVRISTMGMGVGYDEDLLSGIAQDAGGAYYYVDQAESVGLHLDREIDQMEQVVARDPKARIELAEGVELIDIYGYSHNREGNAIIVPMGDLVSGEQRKIVLRLRVRGDKGEIKTLVRCRLGYRKAGSGEREECEALPLQATFTHRAEEVERARDLLILIKVEVVQNAIALDSAMRLQKQGQIDSAQELLAARYRDSLAFNATELRSSEVTRILNRMNQVMLELERTRSDPRARRDLQLRTQLRGLGYVR